MRTMAVAALAGAVVTIALPVVASAQVTRVVAVARPARYDGPCPARFEFIGTIYVAHPTVVTFRWDRSDGAKGPVQSVAINSGGQSVATQWQINGPPGRLYAGWETLHVLTPVDMFSNRATINLACR